MGEVIDEVLPVAVGVAISPALIVAVILLFSLPARTAWVAFPVRRRLVGLGGVVETVTLAVDPDDFTDSDPSTFSSVMAILLVVIGVNTLGQGLAGY